MRELIVTGVGPGAEDQLTVAAIDALKSADCIVAAPRHVPLAELFKKNDAVIITLGNFKETFNEIEKFDAENKNKNIIAAIIVSGDPGIYSLLPLVKKRFADVKLKVLPGISSLQSLCAAAGEMWHDAVILSGHGRSLSSWKFLNTVERNKLTLLFCGEDHSPNWAVNLIINAAGDLANRTEVIIGERLSYHDECITAINPAKYDINQKKIFNGLSLVLIKNNSPWTPPSGRLKDTDFERAENVPMTREEVRSIIIDRLNLDESSVFFDMGAGTGSISASAALEFPDCEVHAIEYDSDALKVMNKNLKKFKVHNMKIHAGRALKVLDELINNKKIPSHVFIGGSEGELREIIKRLEELNSPVRVLVSAVTLDTLSEAVNILLNNKKWENLEAVQAAISATRPLGKSLLMSARNPVTILSSERALLMHNENLSG